MSILLRIVPRYVLRAAILAAAMALSIGWCPLLSENCQWGKWMASILIMGICLCMKGKHWRWSTMALLATWAWCQTADATAGCWKAQHAAWGMACIAIFHATQGIHPKKWCRFVCISTCALATLLALRLCGMHFPWSIQLFNNPAGEAAALALGWSCCLPLLLPMAKPTEKCCLWKPLLAVSLGLLIVFLLYWRSRTGFLAVLLPTSFWLFPILRKRLRHAKWLYAIGAFACLPLAFALYGRNADSADGRCLIYRSVWSLCTERPFCGWGSDAMQARYMAAQARMLSSEANARDAWLASDVTHPFHEGLGWLLNYGLIGCVLLACAIVCIIRETRTEYRYWLLCLCICWMVLSLFSYPSAYAYALLLFLGTIGTAVKGKSTENCSICTQKANAWMKALVGLNLIFNFVAARTEWHKERVLHFSANDHALLSHFKAMHETLHTNEACDYAYAAELNLSGNFQESQQLLSHLKGRMQNYDTEILAADNALSLQHWSEAETHFTLAHQMVPVRFTPLYGLMQTYAQRGDTMQARHTARLILHKRIKVNGAEVESIRQEARTLLATPAR